VGFQQFFGFRTTQTGWETGILTLLVSVLFLNLEYRVIQRDLFIPKRWRSPTTFEFGPRELTIPERSPAELPGKPTPYPKKKHRHPLGGSSHLISG